MERDKYKPNRSNVIEGVLEKGASKSFTQISKLGPRTPFPKYNNIHQKQIIGISTTYVVSRRWNFHNPF